MWLPIGPAEVADEARTNIENTQCERVQKFRRGYGWRPMRIRALSLPLLLTVALALACGREPTQRRAVVIGIDSADWRVIEPLIEAGRMPNLASLRERGTSGPIQTLADFPLSPVVWTSVATGKTPGKHGITWFLVDQPDGSRVPVRSHNRQVKALWNILAAPAGARPRWAGGRPIPPRTSARASSSRTRSASTASAAPRARATTAGKTWPPERFAEFDALVPPEQQVSAEFAHALPAPDARGVQRRALRPRALPEARPGQSGAPLPAVRRHGPGLHRHRREAARPSPTTSSCSTTSRSTASRTCS